MELGDLTVGDGALAWGAGHDTHSAEHLAGAEHWVSAAGSCSLYFLPLEAEPWV